MKAMWWVSNNQKGGLQPVNVVHKMTSDYHKCYDRLKVTETSGMSASNYLSLGLPHSSNVTVHGSFSLS